MFNKERRHHRTPSSSQVKDESRGIESDNDDDDKSKCSSVISPVKSCLTREGSDLSSMEVKCSPDSKTNLKRPRKVYQWERRTINKELWKLKSADRNTDKNYNFSLKISNFPTDWGLDEIKDVVINNYGPVDYVYTAIEDDKWFVGMLKLKFSNFTDCQKAYEAFHGKIINEIKLFAEIRDLDEESDDEAASAKKKKHSSGPWRPDVDIWEADPRGLYGFQPEYLSSLGIQPPLQKWVQVTNFRCDKSELKEVMELAGQVLLCSVDTRTSRIAHVMYSHPLEAVQAVSMLNDQHFYGQLLKVTMEKSPDTKTLLPKGLQGVGPGLGADGNPLRDVIKQYKRFVQYKSSYINSTLFSSPDDLFSNNDNSNHRNVYPSTNPVKCNSSANYNSGDSNFSQFGHSSQGFSGHVPVGNIEGSWPTSGSKQTMSSSASVQGLGPMTGSVPMHGSGGPMSGSVPMHGSGGPGSMLNSGPICGPGSMSGPGLMSGPGSMSNSGPMCGPGPMNGPGLRSGPGPMNGTALMPNSGPMCGPGSMSGPGPMCNPSSISGPGPMSGPGFGPMSRPGSMSGPMCGPGPMSSSMSAPGQMAGSMSGPVSMLGPSVPKFGPANQIAPMGMIGSRPSTNNQVVVELCNLPLSTTFSLLCEKMSECGQVMSVQLTSPGCAVVQFAQRVHAEKCFNDYSTLLL